MRKIEVDWWLDDDALNENWEYIASYDLIEFQVEGFTKVHAAIIPESDRYCGWFENKDKYEMFNTSCGKDYYLGYISREIKYCPFCGREIRVDIS